MKNMHPEFDRRGNIIETRDEQINRLVRQLREAQAKIDKAFDQGAAMVVRSLHAGATIDQVAEKIRWELVDGGPPAAPRIVDWDEPTEPVAIPFGALK